MSESNVKYTEAEALEFHSRAPDRARGTREIPPGRANPGPERAGFAETASRSAARAALNRRR